MSRTLYIGKTKSGKTYLMNKHVQDVYNKFVLTGKRDLKIILLSPTASLQPSLHWMKKFVIFHRETINEIIAAEVYDKCWDNVKENKIREKKKKKPVELLIIIDDLGENCFQKRNQKQNTFKMMATNNAHFKHVHMMWLIQRMVQAAVTLRDNSDFVYCFKLENKDDIKNLYKWFCGDLEEIDFKRLTNKAWGTPKNPKHFGYIFIDRYNPQESKKYYANNELLNF